jgi:hypothetical protein
VFVMPLSFFNYPSDSEDDISLTTLPPNFTFCGPIWTEIWSHYNSADDFIVFFVCSIGVFVNLFNLAVFTRPHMRNPTNLILTALSIADFLCVARGLEELILINSRRIYGDGRKTLGVVSLDLVNYILANVRFFKTIIFFFSVFSNVWSFFL